ncbi:MAG: ArnT family glycosyltransferase, partial [Vicinamibacterales bacterium]
DPMTLRLGLVCLVALLHAAIYIVHQQPDWATEWTDQVGYKRLGAVLAETGQFTRYPDSPAFVPEVIRTPGYPIFVAAVYKLFGLDNTLAVVVAQSFVFAGVCLLVFATARQLLSEKGALVAALATACFSPFPYFGALVVTELWATFLLTAAVWMTFRARASNSVWRAIIAGLLVAATSLTRPVFILFPVALFGMAAIVDRFRHWKLWVIATAMAGLGVLPWFAYNYTYLGRFTLSPAGGVGRAMWEGSWQGHWSGRLHNQLTQTADRMSERAALDAEVMRLAAEATHDPAPMLEYVHQWQDIRRIWTEPVDSKERAIARSLADTVYLRVGLENIRRDPAGHVVRRLTYGVFVMWASHIPYRHSEINHLPTAVIRAIWIVQAAILVLAIAGAIRALRTTRWREGWLLLTPGLYVTAVHLPLLTEPRESLPAMPVMLILATAGASDIFYGHHRATSLEIAGP